ncbi:ZCW7 isoform 2 [Hibiscus syriacus]|uniref:ZCW7 isoform 2 n=1 Tax=Hibiscus syriacus TaxID=106335 RepID=A0A6A2WGR8_HIBSY|nr:ZCW7 isoform 2 [Hibiscus syriacus]
MRPLETLLPTETLEIENALSLVPRVKLNLTFHPALPSVSKPIDEWQLKRALIDFLKSSLSVPVTVPEEDLQIKRLKDLKKRKRDEPVAHGALFIRDLGFLSSRKKSEETEDDVKELEKKFLDWRSYVAEKMDGIELNLEGVEYNLAVEIPVSDDFETMKKDWEELLEGRKTRSRYDCIERGSVAMVAEPRVSSKPSMLVTHTIFSTFGKIR